jgi:hypothetical protein
MDSRQVAIVASLLTNDPDVVLENAAIMPGDGPPDDITGQIAAIVAQPWDGWARVVNQKDGRVVFQISGDLATLFDRDEQVSGRHPYEEAFDNSLTVVANQILAQDAPGARADWRIVRRGNMVAYVVRGIDDSAVR